MHSAFAGLSLLVALGCAAPPPATLVGADRPWLEVDVRPDVRVVALELRPAGDGLTLAGLLSLPRPLLPSARTVQIEGLDAHGKALFGRTVQLDVRPGPAFRGGPRTAALGADLPAPPGLAGVRIALGP